ncbi:MAG TPA: succinyl-diaminopimelate desuccinylase [Gaiellaceae bacterium]|nr:succinyl-diaminopimelate desuccinylase [Gaiellaceae bacterium]
MTALADRLAARTLELVDIPSPSGDEEAIREHLLTLVPPQLATAFAGDEAFLFLPERRPGAPLVVLAGHYDTVPAQGNLPGRLADGAVHGLGASDMKGGLAVALELVRDTAGRAENAWDVGLLLFGREELPAEHNPLPALFAGAPALAQAALAILLEPTAGRIEAGCLGNVLARVVFPGRSGHSARPWEADNALAHALRALAPLADLEPRRVEVAGLTFVETLSVTRLEAGIADNVIPDRATATLSFRYAPDRTPAEAEERLRALLPPPAELEVVGNSPPGGVVADAPSVRALLDAGALGLQPKLAWTNVADFTARGIDAVNFGPGDPAYAHRRDELVRVDALVHAYETLRRFLRTPMREDAG